MRSRRGSHRTCGGCRCSTDDGEDNITLSEGRDPASAVSSGTVRDGDNYTQSEITRTSAQTMPVCQVVTEIGAGLMWQANKAAVAGTANATGRRLSESRMRDTSQPHVRFEVAGDGNQDVISQAPSPDPTRRCTTLRLARIVGSAAAFAGQRQHACAGHGHSWTPLEDKVVTISRATTTLSFLANFMLVAAMNPCPVAISAMR